MPCRLVPGAPCEAWLFREVYMPNSTFWKKFFLVLKVIEVRLRFIAILAGHRAGDRLLGHHHQLLGQVDPLRPDRDHKLAKDEEFYCPMHPQVVRDDFDPNGQTPHCPICGMPLSLRKKGAPPFCPRA